MAWQVQDAKNRFSELINRARSEGPQLVTRHGQPVVEVVAIGSAPGAGRVNAGLSEARSSDGFAQYLLQAPRGASVQAPLRRSRKLPVNLGS